jgi:hypothetical protein
MKKFVYVTSFTLLGGLLATIIHAAIEIPVLKIITSDLEKYGNTFLWQHWGVIHGTVSGVLWFLGLSIGAGLGFRFWRILYVEKRYGVPRF